MKDTNAQIANYTAGDQRAQQERQDAQATREEIQRKAQWQSEYNRLLDDYYNKQKQILTLQYKMNGFGVPEQQKAAWQRSINELQNQQAGILDKIEGYEANGISNAQRENKLKEDLINKENALAGAKSNSHAIGDKLLSQVTMMLRSYIGIMGLRKLWSSATEYAKEYYDLINEIRMVTGKTESDGANLEERYRSLAKELKASSTEIATAAVTYYRQGLDDDAVQERLLATTKYAKIAGVEFDAAADIITSSVNTMGITAEHASDVFIALGNSAGSSAEEIGTAMQKASASAQAAGVSFEWLGAYIATVSENTRQSAESIGTAMSTIMSRLHSIKANGFNSEDETKVNDIAKALANIGVSLFDVNGEWRDMTDVFTDISQQWGGLSDKTRSYIATVMAGTRQQNYFLSLMGDLSKAVEGNSRAVELYEKAMGAAGTTAASYAIYEESVAAANDRMKASFEGLYDTIVNANFLKSMYSLLGDLADGFATWTRNVDGANLAMIGATAAAVALVAAGAKLIGLVRNFAAMTIASRIQMIAVVIGVVATAITGVVAAVKQHNKEVRGIKDNTATINELAGNVTTLSDKTNKSASAIKQFADLVNKAKSGVQLSNEEIATMAELYGTVKGNADEFNTSLDGGKDSVDNYTSSLHAMNEELRTQLGLLAKASEDRAYANLKDETTLKGYGTSVVGIKNAQNKDAAYSFLVNGGYDAATLRKLQQEANEIAKLNANGMPDGWDNGRGAELQKYLNMQWCLLHLVILRILIRLYIIMV